MNTSGLPKIEDELLTIVNVYAPNKENDRLRLLNSLKKFISTISEQGSKL